MPRAIPKSFGYIDLKNLRDIWQELTMSYTDDVDLVNELWDEIVLNYSSKNRHYHNLNHLEYMMKLAYNYRTEIVDFDILLFSIFYHDLVYNSKRSDNELKSAQLARERLGKIGVANDRIEKCYQQILATKEHTMESDSDTNFMVDFDLAILADKPEKYSDYTEKIRKEYSMYPDFIYNKGRRKVLRHFLNLNEIFKTKEFKSNFEERARKNITNELEER